MTVAQEEKTEIILDNHLFKATYSEKYNEKGELMKEFSFSQICSTEDLVKEIKRLYDIEAKSQQV